jgi:hypothetical protein
LFNKEKETIAKVFDDCRSNMVTAELTKTQQSQSGVLGFTLLTVIRASKIVVKTKYGITELALTGFQLCFHLKNSTAEPGSFHPEIDPSLPPVVPVQREISLQSETTSRSATEISAGAAISPIRPEVKAGASSNEEQQFIKIKIDKEAVALNRRTVTLTQVKSDQFTLSIENPFGSDLHFDQKIFDSRLCYINSLDRDLPVSILPTVQVLPRQVWRGSGTGVFGKQLHKNQDKIINRIIAKLANDHWALNAFEVENEKSDQ